MKIKIIAAILLTVTFFSCTKKSDNNSNTTITTGTWRISLYWDKKDETSNFSSYTFMFNSGGELMAHKSATVITGTWSETGTRLTINFTDPVLSSLNGNWLKTEKTSTGIKLKDDNPLQDDQLHFVKN